MYGDILNKKFTAYYLKCHNTAMSKKQEIGDIVHF